MHIHTESQQVAEQNYARTHKIIAGSAAALLGVTLVVVGLLLTVPRANAATPVSSADQAFMLAAAQGGMLEVTLGELAAKQGLREDVKAFGALMVRDHKTINAALKVLAEQKGLPLPTELDDVGKALVERMAALSADAFDNAYIDEMIKDHGNDLRDFRAESVQTKDVDIKSFVEQSLPVVEAHLQHVHSMKK